MEVRLKAKKSDDTHELYLELKYCERCGGLWLRPRDGEQVYCVRCAHEMAQLPDPPRRRSSVRNRVDVARTWTDANDFEACSNDPEFNDEAGGVA
jgi:hypothetical protein